MHSEENKKEVIEISNQAKQSQMNFPHPIPVQHQLLAAYPDLFTDDDVAVQFLIAAQIVVVPVQCMNCGGQMVPEARSHYQYRCTAHACPCSVSILKGSFFSGSHGIARLLQLCYYILADMKHGSIHTVTGYDPKTITKWRRVIQEMMAIDEQSLPDEERMLGGPNWLDGTDAEIEMDESKFAKIKYGYGHPVTAGWVYGLIERRRGDVMGKFVAFAVDDRSAETLEAIWSAYIRPGSIVYSDMWKGYRTWVMNTFAILHRTVNHSLFFKDPLTGVHTNTIEGMWAAVKKTIPPQCRGAAKLQPYLWEFVWRRRNKHQIWTRFLFLLRVVRYDGNVPIPPVQVHMPIPAVQHAEEDNEFAWENMCVIS